MSVDDVTKLLLPLGAAMGWVILLWLRRSDRQEDQVKELMEKRVQDAEKARDEALATAERERVAAAKERRHKLAYWRQLVQADIEPVPPLDGGGDT